MKRSLSTAVIIALLLTAAPAYAGWNWSVNIGIPLPGLVYYAPAYAPAPPVVYAPAPVYVEPAPVFYGGAWYRASGSRWFISAYAAGPWYVIGYENVPRAVISPPQVQERHEYVPPSYGERHHREMHDNGALLRPYRVERLGDRDDD